MNFALKPHRTGSRRTLALVLTLLIGSGLAAAVSGQSLADRLDEYLNAAHDVQQFHGAALIAKDGKPILKKGYGMASIELGVPNTPDKKFLIGSITKQFTAVAVLQLVEKGLVSLDDPVTKFVPEYPKETADGVTIHHLLRHSSGVPSYTDDLDLMARRTEPGTMEEILAAFKDKPLEFEPGEKYKYSNSGYALLGLVIEKASGMSYEDYLRQNVLGPAGMKNSGYGHHDIILPGRAVGYTEGENDELLNAYVVHMSWPYSAGALYSTVEDMLLWDQALYTDKLLSQGSIDKMFTAGLGNYGYGWGVRKAFDRRVVRHNGGIDGFYTSFMRFIDDKVCIVVFSNNDSAPVDDIANGLAAVTFGELYELPAVKTPIEIEPELLADYEGVYRVDSVDHRIVTVEDGRIYSMRTGGQRLEIFPEARDKFYFEHNHMLTVEFVRDESGKVVHHVMHRVTGDEDPAVKLSDAEAEKVLAVYKPAEVDPAIYDDYVGEYRLMPEFTIVVALRGDRLFTQATGQEEAEIFPRSESRFFLKVIDAELEFVRDETGKVTGLVFYQGEREMPAEKIK
ncbi:MAG: serine hydrolase [Candidatus Zixiibacteriota bacterium]|nr:MAG: serine hydrolase [candidate division Zixibacteria bacterium]